MMTNIIIRLFLWFIFYSFIGWIYECILCSVIAKRFINRGFLNGPYCPIYGCGAILNIFIIGNQNNILVIFLGGVLLNCILEYLTSYIMEKIFHARWWDYSDRKYNINGRVCLIGAIIFGLLTVLLIKFLHPLVLNITNKIPLYYLHIGALIILIIFGIDCIITLKEIVDFNKLLGDIENNLAKVNNNLINQLTNFPLIGKGKSIYEKFAKKISKQQYRLITVFPKFKSLRYSNVFDKLKKYINKKDKSV